ncbi:MAG: metalloregulator ArsR/SmtB family transcription factor [Alphaproteobacteria bacterium]|nr:metalloregulator ArsR/SmtB family transcription factor [Alphaproteobacteria bacterium]
MLDRAHFEDEAQLDEMADNAKRATDFLKALAHEARLMILCYLVSGEKSVKELEDLLSLRQPTVSQQLARLRIEGFIDARRDGKMIYYSLADHRAKVMVEQIYEMFCKQDGKDKV